MSLKSILKDQSAKTYIESIADYHLSLGCKSREFLLDAITPNCLAIMKNIPPTSQALVHLLVVTKKDLSLFVTTNTLSKQLREPSKVVTVYLKKLWDIGLVEKQKVNNKNYEFRIASKVFFDWYLFRYKVRD